MKKSIVYRKITSNILPDTNGTLLTVQHLVTTVFSNHPIHHVQWKYFFDCFYHGIALPFLIHKLALIFWTNVQLAFIGCHTLFGAVFITSYHFTHWNFV